MQRSLIPFVLLPLAAAVSLSARGQDVATGQARAVACAGCHGPDGNSAVPTWPRLAGQQPAYIVKQLADFQSGHRTDPMMSGLARALSAEDRVAIAAWFASQTPRPGPTTGDVALGRAIYHRGIVETGVPACDVCHGPDGMGSPGYGGGGFPAVGGQHEVYAAKQLRDFAAGRRSNDVGGMMGQVAAKLSEPEILAVAAYLQTLNPGARP